MPTYIYLCEKCGKHREQFNTIADRNKGPRCCGKPTINDWVSCQRAAVAHKPTTGWPLYSDAMAVHPDQISEARDDAQRKGVRTDFLPDGRPVFRTRSHRRDYCRAYGVRDLDGGYGDS